MKKRDKIIYWVATIWLSASMLASGTMQLLHMKEQKELFTQLGYPVYFLSILGVWKILGVVAILVPRFPLVKEWAYAGFFFAMSGAFVSHIVLSDPFDEVFPSVLLMLLIATSWYFRPASRKVALPK